MLAISYRREDSGPITGRIFDRLQTAFGRDKVFMDIDSIPFGVDFRTHISHTLGRCEALLVVIGDRWLGPKADGSNRIEEETDFVRLEVSAALSRDILVIPLLVDQTHMPSAKLLPDDLKGIAFRNALRIDSGIDFNHHMDRLCRSLQERQKEVEAEAKKTSPAEAATEEPQPPPTSKPRRSAFGRFCLFVICMLLSVLVVLTAFGVSGGVVASASGSDLVATIFAIVAGLIVAFLVFLFWRKRLWKLLFPKPGH